MHGFPLRVIAMIAPAWLILIAGLNLEPLLLVSRAHPPAPQSPRDETTFLLRAARAVDPLSGRLLGNAVITVRGDRIVVVESASQTPGPKSQIPGAHEVDLGNVTLLPGLIDCHTHNLLQPEDEISPPVVTKSQAFRTIQGVAAAKLNLEAGFTTMRDVDSEGAGFADVALRDAINQGIVPGPRLFVSTYALTITAGHMNLTGMNPDISLPDPAALTDNRDAMIAEVRREVKYGADWIKIYATGTLRHVDRKTLAPMSQLSLEEVKAIVAEAARWRRDVAAHAYGGEGARNAILGGVRSIEHGMMLDDDTLALMVKHGTYWCPTLSVYMPESTQVTSAQTAATASSNGGSEDEFMSRIVASHKRAFQAAMRVGVKITFGTDVGAFPHGRGAREFSHMVDYGMPPLEAIRTATIRAAELLRLERVGAMAPDHLADIIAVRGNPLENIKALEQVTFVMKGGKIVKRPAS